MHIAPPSHVNILIRKSAWKLSESLLRQIRMLPGTVGKLSCLFSKASSVMEVPLMRLAQAGSSHLEAVSLYYSKALLSFAKKVFQVSLMAHVGSAEDPLAWVGSRKTLDRGRIDVYLDYRV